MPNCSVCGEICDNDIRLLNHMMEKHGWRNPKLESQIETVEDINLQFFK